VPWREDRLSGVARAEVTTRVEIARRMDLGSSGYEKIIGTIHFAVDPLKVCQRDRRRIEQAPVNAAGRRVFLRSLHPQISKPPRGTGAALVDCSTAATRSLVRLQPRRVAGSRHRERSRRSVPDAFRVHHRLGRVGTPRTADDEKIHVPLPPPRVFQGGCPAVEGPPARSDHRHRAPRGRRTHP
jgi:hypothetical protein